MSSHRITPAGVAGTALALLAIVVCARLGVWQLDRHSQRKAQNERIAEQIALPILPLSADDGDAESLAYRRVELEGEYDHTRSIIWPGHAYQGSPGVHVLTPLRRDNGDAVLVNRGWVHSPDAASVDLEELEVHGTVALTGLVRTFPESDVLPDESVRAAREGRVIEIADAPDDPETGGFRRTWYRFDLDALRGQFPYPLSDFYVQALPDEAASEPPMRLDPPGLGSGPHLGYAIQWFSFGLIALLGWLVVITRQGKTDRRGPPSVAAGRSAPGRVAEHGDE